MGKTGWTGVRWEPVISDHRDQMSWVRDPAMPPGHDTIALVGASEPETERERATLIAASPALYEALEALIDICQARIGQLTTGEIHDLEIAKTVRARARGE